MGAGQPHLLSCGRRGGSSEAERAAAEAIERRPDDPYVRTAAAWVASGQDREDEAVSRVEQALAIDPRDSWALRSRVDFLRSARRFEEAERAAAEAIERRPDEPGRAHGRGVGGQRSGPAG